MLFEHGVFNAADTAGTAHALVWLALGLPAHVLVKALSPAFFAREDTATPLLATLKGLGVAIASAVVLGWLFGVGGIAASIALGAWSNALSLIRPGAATFGFSIDAAARQRLPRIGAAALAMGALLWLGTPFVLGPEKAAHGGLAPAILVVMLIAGGMAIYGLLLARLGAIRWGDAVNAIRQPSGPDLHR
jgi:putative peptidoglycan lipid II flippase